MVHSSYFIGGYAIHGYASVPPTRRATAACACRSRTRGRSTVGADGRRRRRVSVAWLDARETLIAELRRHALVVGEVTLTSGATAQYYVDAKRAILRPAGFAALGELVAALRTRWEATAVGGLTMGADAPACAALAGGADVKAFFVRKETKQHGLQRRVEGPPLEPGERCLIVEDVVTTGGSTVAGDRGRARRGPRRLRRRGDPRPARRRRRRDRGAPPTGRRTRRWPRSTTSTRPPDRGWELRH